jgi:hypothetical protein
MHHRETASGAGCARRARRPALCALAAFALSAIGSDAEATAICTQLQDAVAVRAAAVQQEMMVAALTCHDIEKYNRFVNIHQRELQQSEAVLMNFFVRQSALTGFGDYNLFKTELANASSLRSVRDGLFCRRVDANFDAAFGRNEPLAQLLPELPYGVDTGSVRCPEYDLRLSAVAAPAPGRMLRHRTWIGRLLDSIRSIFD